MSTENNSIREQILIFYLENPDTELMAIEIADRFGYLPSLPRSVRSMKVRDIKKSARRKSPEDTLVLRSKWQQQKKGGEIIELKSWRAKESEFLEQLDRIKTSLYDTLKELSPLEINKSYSYERGLYLVEINLPDYHFGKADGRSIDQQCEDYLRAVQYLINRASAYEIDKILLVIGNDMFQVDNAQNATTRGTIIDRNCDWDEMYTKGISAVIKAINLLVSYAPVDVISVPGNHDQVLSFTASETLRHYYHNVDSVTVCESNAHNRKCYTYGRVMLAYTHGDKEKLNELPLILAVEYPEAWAKCPYRYIKLGHLHHTIVKEIQGVEIETLAALCKADKWHKQHGYYSRPKAQLSLYSRDRGKEGVLIYNPE